MPEWRKVARLEHVEEGMPLGIELDGQSVGLFRLGERCYAVSNVCTHEFALLSDGWQDGQVVECPLHQARFDITTGKCVGPPAEQDLRVFEVRVEAGEIHVLLPEREGGDPKD